MLFPFSVSLNFASSLCIATADRIARWDGTSWHSLGYGFDKNVYAIAVLGDNIFVGGEFTDAFEDPDIDHIALWGGNTSCIYLHLPHIVRQ